MKNEISLVFDFLDPWGWLAERRLRQAMRATQVAGPITYLPCRTGLSSKAIGLSFGDYQQLRFGNQAETHEKRLITQACSLGLQLSPSKVEKIPDPWLAMLALSVEHRHAPELFEAIYRAIFRDGLDVANVEVMAELLLCVSSDITVQNLPEGGAVVSEFLEREKRASQWAQSLTPCIRIGDALVSGAQPASLLEQLLARPVPADAMTPSAACISVDPCVTRNIVER